jgi:hypothetical protein
MELVAGRASPRRCGHPGALNKEGIAWIGLAGWSRSCWCGSCSSGNHKGAGEFDHRLGMGLDHVGGVSIMKDRLPSGMVGIAGRPSGSSSVVERLLAKEKVAGSSPVSRSSP